LLKLLDKKSKAVVKRRCEINRRPGTPREASTRQRIKVGRRRERIETIKPNNGSGKLPGWYGLKKNILFGQRQEGGERLGRVFSFRGYTGKPKKINKTEEEKE